MHSICDTLSGKGRICYLYITFGFKKEDQLELLESITQEEVNLYFRNVNPAMFENFPESERYPRLVYYRIFAAKLLPDTLERILYLDSDTIVINPLEDLYNMEFKGNYFLACTHVKKFLNKMNQFRLGIEDEQVYINSGVMLMNLRELRIKQKEREVYDYVAKKKRHLILPDQDIITAVYGKKTGILDTMIYNLSDRMLTVFNSSGTERRNLQWVRENTVIIHYYGKNKPWNRHYQGILDVFYRELQEQIYIGS